jgi:hypothetical protein
MRGCDRVGEGVEAGGSSSQSDRSPIAAVTTRLRIYRFMCFIQQLVDRTVTEIGRTDFMIDDGQSLAA